MTLYTGILDVYHGDADNVRGYHGVSEQVHGPLTEALATAKAAGVGALIAKATQGKDYVDPAFGDWESAADANGLLFGAYHFGSATEAGDLQADWFTSHALAIAAPLLVLDWEPNPNAGGTMDGPNAVLFVERIYAVTGRYPVLYCDSSHAARLRDPALTALRQCPLWVAAYGRYGVDGPSTPYPWTLWQYVGAESSDGEHPDDTTTFPIHTPGLGQVDRSVFRGAYDELKTWWRG